MVYISIMHIPVIFFYYHVIVFSDDLPRPSPRVKKDKSRQGSVSRAHKLDEPKNLRVNFSLKVIFLIDKGLRIVSNHIFLCPIYGHYVFWSVGLFVCPFVPLQVKVFGQGNF